MLDALLASKLSNAAATGYLLLDTLLLMFIMYAIQLIFSQTEPMKKLIVNIINNYFFKQEYIPPTPKYKVKISREVILIDKGWTEMEEDKCNKYLLDALYEKINSYNVVSRNFEVNLSSLDTSIYSRRINMINKNIQYKSN